jgi:signal transduction histidine kinase/ActR/RegA family two-component response regulator
MPLADYVAFFPSLGWLAALMLAALLPSLPHHPWRNHAGWLIAFCAACLLVQAQELVWTAPIAEWRAAGLVLSGMLLWEFARRCWNDHGTRRLSAGLHLLTLECLVLMAVVVFVTKEGMRPRWFPVAEQAFMTLPILLGGSSLLLLWRSAHAPERRKAAAVRVALIGLALYGIGAGSGASTAIAAVPSWTVSTALAVICFVEPETRTRSALLCAGGLLATALVGPLIVSLSLREVDARQHDDLLARAERAAAPLQGAMARRFTQHALSADSSRAIQQHLEKIALHDPLMRSASIWKLERAHVKRLDFAAGAAAEFVDAHPPNPHERARAHEARAFIEPPAAGKPVGVATVHAPLTAALFESPTAWLSLSYPQAFWEVQRQHARRMGVTIIGVFTGFCAMGFVLAGRQAIEHAQRLAIERAQSASQAKTEFLAFLSHEMRTPLQTILGRTELLWAGPDANEESRRHAAAIETQGRLLLRLVTDLLDLGTLEAGKFQLRPRAFSLRQVVAAVEDTMRATALAKNLTLEVAIAASVPDSLVGDEARLRQILGNLLGNAVKYTACGEVRLAIAEAGMSQEPTAARLVFRITDTGPGLPPDKIDQLFTLFTRLDRGDTFTREGTGVGLALVRKLCALMGGTVAAANRPEGGAEFTVELPFPLDPHSAVATENSAQPSNATSLHVLVAEDNTAGREFITEALHALGHEVVAVADGEAALLAAMSGRFHVAILDVNLPGRDGIAVASALRSRDKNLRIIGCSAEANEAVRQAALAAGMDVYLQKPVGMDDLSRAIAPPDALEPAPAPGSIFSQLQSTQARTRARAVLQAEWPALRAAATAACASGEVAACQRCAHYLQSSALLLADEPLLDFCRKLSAAGQTGALDLAREMLAKIDAHIATSAESFCSTSPRQVSTKC